MELKLTVKPHIGDGDDIRLEINQTAEELAGTSTSAGPITSTRSQKTTVVARNEETLVLGGIMQDRDIDQVSKVPLLGDLPILGHLFRNTVKKRTKVNLLVFLTPHIIRDASDFKRVVERKMRERARAAAWANAERQARQLAELAGVALGRVHTISEQSGFAPVPMAAMAAKEQQSGAAIGIEPGVVAVEVTLGVQWTIA